MTMIFEGNLTEGFSLGRLSAVPSPTPCRFEELPNGWDIYEEGTTHPIMWAVSLVEALRYLKAKDDNLRNAQAAQEMVRWAITEKKARQQ